MPKARPLQSIAHVESVLGYKIDTSNYPDESVRRFYSSLRVVPDGTYERAIEDYDVYTLKPSRASTASLAALPTLGSVETIAHGDDIIRLTHRGHVAHGNPLDIQYSFGVHLYLLLTKDEAAKIMSVASLRRSPVPSISHLPMFFDKLPRELRDRIYDYVFPQQYWSLDEDVSGFTDLDLLGSVSDCSGFYFPLAPKSGILAVNQQMREEALPWAYRSTSFELNDVDNVVKLLLGIGKIGRENIKILAFGWQSNCETDFEWDEAPGKVTVECTRNEDLLLTLPVIHVDTCMKLLKQCVGLTHLRLNFEKELIDFIEPEAFKANAGIRELSSLRGLREVDFWSLDQEPLDNKEAPIKWLKERLESPVS